MRNPEWLFEAIVAVIFLAVGLFALLKPVEFYRISESWKSYRPSDPSDGYLLMVRIGGGILTAIGLFMVVMAVISLLK